MTHFTGPQSYNLTQRRAYNAVRAANPEVEYVHGWCGPGYEGVCWAMVCIAGMGSLTAGQVVDVFVYFTPEQRRHQPRNSEGIRAAGYLCKGTVLWNGSTQLLPYAHTLGGFAVTTAKLEYGARLRDGRTVHFYRRTPITCTTCPVEVQ